jgi:dihydrolipoamide dehydrogenase
MSATLKVDVVIIGAGTAGLAAFAEVTKAGKSALLVDHGPLGTTCARVGCMPSKAALHAGQEWAAHRAMASLAGQATDPGTAPDALWSRVRATRDALTAGAAERTRKVAGDRLLEGTARFTGPRALVVGEQPVEADAFVVATGSRPVVPEAFASLGARLFTTDTLFDMDTLPRRFGVVGAGAIGFEMGLALARLGVEVVAAESGRVVAGAVDPEINARAVKRMSAEATLWLGDEVKAQMRGDAIVFQACDRTKEVDAVLVAVGRRPNTDTLDLARADVRFDAHGHPVFDPETLRCTGSHVLLAGDSAADRPLQHEAAAEGRIAAQGALRLLQGLEPVAATRSVPLSIVFSDPDIASVGERFDRLDAKSVVIGSAEGSANGRSRILGAEDNLVRLYADRATGRLLGASLIAVHGEHLAQLLAWAIQRGETAHDLLALPFYHPTVEEMLQTALKDIESQRAR